MQIWITAPRDTRGDSLTIFLHSEIKFPTLFSYKMKTKRLFYYLCKWGFAPIFATKIQKNIKVQQIPRYFFNKVFLQHPFPHSYSLE